MADLCPDCKRPLATTAHEQAVGGYCWNESECLRAQLASALQRAEAAERSLLAWEQMAKASSIVGGRARFFPQKGQCASAWNGQTHTAPTFTEATVVIAQRLGLLDAAGTVKP